MVAGACLCGDVSFEIDGPFESMAHCHCSRCRKHHGSAFATYVGVATKYFRFLTGASDIVTWTSDRGFDRYFCGRCGSVCPGPDPRGDVMFVAAGNVMGDCRVDDAAHMYVASKAPWYEITDAAPRFDASPPGWEDPGIEPAPNAATTTGTLGGSCLCGGIEFAIYGRPIVMGHCHCSRCRRGRSAAHATNVFVAFDQFRWLRGEDLVKVFDLPGAERFGVDFCSRCGSDVPRHSPKIGRVNVPAGCLDADPGIRPSFHIYVGSKAPWFEITDSIPQFVEAAPPTR